jgi:hypothetical protein
MKRAANDNGSNKSKTARYLVNFALGYSHLKDFFWPFFSGAARPKEADEEENLELSAQSNPEVRGSLANSTATLSQVAPSVDSARALSHEATALSYPNPRNFAERLISALQRGIGTSCLTWIGDGRAIALHSKNIKNSTEFLQHFRLPKYSNLIRSCTRWCVNLFDIGRHLLPMLCELIIP